MAFPTFSAAQQRFIPEVFSKKLQAKFYAASVLPQISNTDWQGEISGQGDKVHIRSVPTVSINDYTGSVTYADVTTTDTELLIDQAKYFAFNADDILAGQSDIDMVNQASQDAAEQMKISVDTTVLGAIYSGLSAGVDDTGAVASSSNILGYVLDAGQKLDEANVPESGRFLVLAPKHINMLKQSDLKSVNITGDGTSPLRNGQVGTIDRFTVYSSNNLPTVSGQKMSYAGTKHGIAFASQISQVETVRREATFGDGVRGLNVFGYKIVKEDALCLMKLT